LAVAIPIARPLVLTFGSPEFFMLTILGITFVASLSGGTLLKGLISGGIGMFLATIGLDPISGIQRYTFGQLFLWDGIGLVPITIGFFAIPEVIDLAIQGSSIAQEQVDRLGGVLEGVKDTFRHWWLVIRCSAIGTFIGIVPGMGAALTQWLAYAHAAQSSPDKERFGKGAVEGVLGPGAANNSALGGSLVTTIAFGVPASIMMAILLGAFLIQGLVPGPDMLLPERSGGHLSLTFSFVWTIIISNIITVSVCFLFLNQLVKITKVRGSLVIPFILLLIYLGAFAEKNTIEDLILVLFSGALGWEMQRLNWPRPPLILGLVLGPLAENRLFLSTDNYGLIWMLRPGVLFIIALTLAGVFYPILKTKWQKGKKKMVEPSALRIETRSRPWPFRVNQVALFSFLIVVVFILALLKSREFNFRAGLFPWTIGFSVLLLGIVQFIRDFIGRKDIGNVESFLEGKKEIPNDVAHRRTIGILSWLIGFFTAILFLGFSIGGPFCIFIYLKMSARERWPLTLILTATTWVSIFGLFGHLLHVPFPPGLLFSWL